MALLLKDVLNETYEFSMINESGLSRLFSGIYSGGIKKDFCVMSAFRKNYTLKQNRIRNKQIYVELSKYKMGGYPLIGHWKEAPDDMDWETTPDELKTPVTEESIWFYRADTISLENFEEICFTLCKKFNQDSVIVGISSDESKQGIYYFKKDGSRSLAFNSVKIRPEELGDAYSIMRGNPNNPFVFEGLAHPSNIISNMMFKHHNMLWFSK
jgi:hypothetical protein